MLVFYLKMIAKDSSILISSSDVYKANCVSMKKLSVKRLTEQSHNCKNHSLIFADRTFTNLIYISKQDLIIVLDRENKQLLKVNYPTVKEYGEPIPGVYNETIMKHSIDKKLLYLNCTNNTLVILSNLRNERYVCCHRFILSTSLGMIIDLVPVSNDGVAILFISGVIQFIYFNGLKKIIKQFSMNVKNMIESSSPFSLRTNISYIKELDIMIVATRKTWRRFLVEKRCNVILVFRFNISLGVNLLSKIELQTSEPVWDHMLAINIKDQKIRLFGVNNTPPNLIFSLHELDIKTLEIKKLEAIEKRSSATNYSNNLYFDRWGSSIWMVDHRCRVFRITFPQQKSEEETDEGEMIQENDN